MNINADGGGKFSGGSTKWYKAGTKLVLNCGRPIRVSCSTAGMEACRKQRASKLTVYTDHPLELIAAVFRPDSDRDGMDDDWEKQYIGNLSGTT